MVLGDTLKKVLLAGLGTVATTAEKSKEILDELVKKGELTVEQGKILDRDLPKIDKEFPKKTFQNIKEKVAKATSQDDDSLRSVVENMTEDKLNKLKELISEMEAKLANEPAEAEEAAQEAVADAEEAVEEAPAEPEIIPISEDVEIAPETEE